MFITSFENSQRYAAIFMLKNGNYLVGVHSKKTAECLSTYQLDHLPAVTTYSALIKYVKNHQVSTLCSPTANTVFNSEGGSFK